MDKSVDTEERRLPYDPFSHPPVFCWTRMGHEAGQSLHGIIARKDAERTLGDGLFFWGIGTALGPRFWKFIDGTERPSVLFSPMKAKARAIDVRPARVFAWTAYLDRRGVKHRMPQHVLVTSRGSAALEGKRKHYALVCRKGEPLLGSPRPAVEWRRLRNYEGSSKLGFSQVTAVVEMADKPAPLSSSYEVLFDAELAPPYYVTLADPVQVPGDTLNEVNALWANGCAASEWGQWLESYRAHTRVAHETGEFELPFDGKEDR